MLNNYAHFNIQDFIFLFGENALFNFPPELQCTGISTDTRTIEQGNLFLALIGENSDGHDRVQEAFSKGASAACIENNWYDKNINQVQNQPLIIVGSTLKALAILANYHRKRFIYPVVAIGGSNGKTTTKNMTAHVLSSKYNVLKTSENYNNQIGVPLTLLQMSDEHDIVVIEMGTNEPGEIAILSEIIEPTHGLITNIGKEHLEKLIDLDGVEMEETFLFGFLKRKAGVAFVNLDDDRLKKYPLVLDKKFTFGQSPDADLHAEIKTDDNLHPIITFTYRDNSLNVNLKTQGFTTALNAIAATTVALNMELSDVEIKSSLESFLPDDTHSYGRMVIEKLNGITLINDCYNANPDSMIAALNTIKSLNCIGKKIAVLGDMRELGSASFEEHCAIIKLASESADKVFIHGNEMKKALASLSGLSNIFHFEEKSALIEKLIEVLQANDCLLVKGSRGMKMEEIITALKLNFV